MKYNTSSTFFQINFIFDRLLPLILSYSLCHKFPIGYKSSDREGHYGTPILFHLNHFRQYIFSFSHTYFFYLYWMFKIVFAISLLLRGILHYNATNFLYIYWIYKLLYRLIIAIQYYWLYCIAVVSIIPYYGNLIC